MLMRRDRCALLVVDIQARLLPHMHDWQRVLEHSLWLARLARRLDVPVIATEQYPKGLGRTEPALRELIPDACVAEKLHFSCVAAGCLPGLPGGDRRQMVVCGIESHVCVLQTVLELKEQGREVFVVADAVGSRRESDRELAISRMRAHGIDVVSREMVGFEWLHQAGSDEFRAVSAEFLR